MTIIPFGYRIEDEKAVPDEVDAAKKTASLVRHASAAIGLSLLMQKSRMTRESRAESI